VDHLSMIKWHYYISQELGFDGRWVFEALSGEILDVQTFLFKLTMKSQALKAMAEPRDKNPVIKFGVNLPQIIYWFTVFLSLCNLLN
jgi:hypothetical protein